jgi:hypothetical protein
MVGRKPMARIIVEPAAAGNDPSDSSLKALKLLGESGIKPRSGPRLVSKYAVIPVQLCESR